MKASNTDWDLNGTTKVSIKQIKQKKNRSKTKYDKKTKKTRENTIKKKRDEKTDENNIYSQIELVRSDGRYNTRKIFDRFTIVDEPKWRENEQFMTWKELWYNRIHWDEDYYENGWCAPKYTDNEEDEEEVSVLNRTQRYMIDRTPTRNQQNSNESSNESSNETTSIPIQNVWEHKQYWEELYRQMRDEELDKWQQRDDYHWLSHSARECLDECPFTEDPYDDDW